jgi:hypothetical protein
LSTCCLGPSGEDDINSELCAATIESADRLCPHSIYNCSTRLTRRLTVDDRETFETPVLFWPLPSDLFEGTGELEEGRSAFFWKERISTAWGKHFVNYEKFLKPACELEFLLELNSYFGMNAMEDLNIDHWLKTRGRDESFSYNPDLFAYGLHCTARIAEQCYELISRDAAFPSYLAVEPVLFELAFKGKSREERLLIYGGVLHGLRTSLAQFMMQRRRFALGYGWQGRLRELVQKYEGQLKRAQT